MFRIFTIIYLNSVCHFKLWDFIKFVFFCLIDLTLEIIISFSTTHSTLKGLHTSFERTKNIYIIVYAIVYAASRKFILTKSEGLTIVISFVSWDLVEICEY